MPLRPLLPTAALILGGLFASMWAGWQLSYERALESENHDLRRQLQLYTQALNQAIDRYRTLPRVLALDDGLRQALSQPIDEVQQRALNLKLERANSVTQASTLTLLDRNGIALAASNWREPTSNVGEDYAFRPYVQQAIAAGSGRFYGIGLTTAQPGYFLSQAIRDERGDLLGIVVIKILLAELEREWLSAEDIVLASDEHDVVFLSSRDDWRYRLLSPLGDDEREELRRTRQYADEALRLVQAQTLGATDDGGRLLQVRDPSVESALLWQTVPLPEQGWHLHLLHTADGMDRTARTAAAATGAAWLALAFLALFVQQRRRLAALRARGRDELDLVLKQHAEELRHARDGLVHAAQQADSGLARNLDHLPQGVVVIDAALRIQAWNSRYIELFRLPPDLVRVGAPIEEVFRYNARRGLLGPGPVEEAIQRRLDHLRSGRPHMHERERDDGTVLEIRGNPLPEGGFVTSYADITSYKNAARELRSLADVLERRIEERTRDLDQARHEAVEANRYKTRFVASAVHDLLQPLNAARMFLSALRGPMQGEQRTIADHVESALAAQDGILNSLLDISRLESGTQQVRLEDFALDPLLETLAREFGILAEARGLALRRVPTRVSVRSDAQLLRRILQNLLSNAVRYTARGRILLGLRRCTEGIRIEVHDTGPGIPPTRQREIFEEFRRLDDGGSSERGAGLGLAIVERIGRLLEHPVGLRSAPGRGSVFSVTVPLGNAREHLPQTPVIPAAIHHEDSLLQGCVVWCIDDDARVNEASRALLERWGCVVALAEGADEALQQAAAGIGPPELLLLDVRLGTHHGPALFEQLARHWRRPPQVILVTVEHEEALRALATERGWGLLQKPVKPPALRALMTQHRLRGSPHR